MIDLILAWSWEIFLLITLIAFGLIVWKEGKRYLLYGAFGALFGFLFDSTAVSLGYYDFFLQPQLLGAPVLVIAAEIFCIPIAIYLFEKLIAPLLEREKKEEEGIPLGG